MSEALPASVDVVVVGAGLTGAAAAWSLSDRGIDVAVIDRFGPANAHGSSHGSARIVRRGYADPFYLQLTGAAFEMWRLLEQESGRDLLHMTGGIDHGRFRDVRVMADVMTANGVTHELLPAHVAEERWPGMRFATEVLFHPQAGVVDAESAVAAMLDSAVARGAHVHSGDAVTSIVARRDGALVRLGRGEIRAKQVVLAAGPWLESLVQDGVNATIDLPPLRVTQQNVFHFPRRDETAPPWPVTIMKDELNVYHLPGGRDGGPGGDRKIAEHDGGADVTADTRDGVVDPRARQRMIEHVRAWLPGLEDRPSSETTCLYTSTPNEDFVLDRVGPIVVASPCSGHGAKFAPVLGVLLADLVRGNRVTTPPRFFLEAHRAAGASA